MASRNKRALAVGIVPSKQSRKYLGDPNDPHYVPKSPLIERQKLSANDEAELKKLCGIALADIPHSDHMADDPFRYLVSQITVKAQVKPSTTQNERSVAGRIQEPAIRPTESTFIEGDSATPSECSKRETIQTNGTTPMTTPGVTPGETDKRFSDAGQRPSTSQPSHLRAEIKGFEGNTIYSFLKNPHTAGRPQTATATKSLTHLPSLPRKSKEIVTGDSKDHNEGIFIRPDFNKSLPALPRIPDKADPVHDPVSKGKSSAITRMLKTVRLQRTQQAPNLQTRSTSTDIPFQLQQTQKASEADMAKKYKFSISSMFGKKHATNPKRATVG